PLFHFSLSPIFPPPSSPLFPYTTLFRSVGDLLPRQNVIALLHAGNRRSSDMLGQGIYHFAFRQIFFDGTVFRQLFAVIGMHTALDRKSTRLNSSHVSISYAVFCLKKKKI